MVYKRNARALSDESHCKAVFGKYNHSVSRAQLYGQLGVKSNQCGVLKCRPQNADLVSIYEVQLFLFLASSHREIWTPTQIIQEASAPPYSTASNAITKAVQTPSLNSHVNHMSVIQAKPTVRLPPPSPSNHNHSYSYISPPPTAQPNARPPPSNWPAPTRKSSPCFCFKKTNRPSDRRCTHTKSFSRCAGCRKTAHPLFIPPQSGQRRLSS
ncbi:hypothetical protein GLAREA_03404 [Glarea lozoyensis ATCC 20868]|uniref:Uncharacterized protein n=1 Tax=Glarea lozoyensis (strain ATCC 20868 / MF5171) TaxID=1116229 RepID=S3CVJ7_GLAL2|nr:uncharacterized protein GLAREA_03404 [Glarea lozoyensis ATCC 20868]EPE30437.1 hypothetical protein GLAREA_03404 [Glarea lozoyensis ATCC 20868]